MGYSRLRLTALAITWLALGVVAFVAAPSFGATAGHFCQSPPCPYPAEHGESGIVFGSRFMNASHFHWNDGPSGGSHQYRNRTPDGGLEQVAQLGVDDVFPDEFFIYKNWRYYDADTGQREDVYNWIQVDGNAAVTGPNEGGCPGDDGAEDCDLLAYTSELAAGYIESGLGITLSDYWVVNPEDDQCAISLTEPCLESSGEADAYLEVQDAFFRVHDLSVGYHDRDASKKLTLNNVTFETRFGDGGGHGLTYGRSVNNTYGFHDDPVHQTLSLGWECKGNRGISGNDLAHCEVYEDIGEMGTVLINSMETIYTEGKYANPVVFAWPAEHFGDTHAQPHLENVRTENNATAFDIQIDEWDAVKGTPRSHHDPQDHPLETVHYLVIEQGRYNLTGGLTVEAGIESDNIGSGSWTNDIPFKEPFGTQPAMIIQGQTGSDYGCGLGCSTYDDSFTVRLRNVGTTDFDARLQEQEAYTDGHLAQEDIGYLAVAPGVGNQSLNQTYRLGQYISRDDRKDITYSDRRYEAGIVTDVPDQANPKHISFNGNYADPVFMAHSITANDIDEGAIRWENLDGNGADVFFEEDKTSDSEIDHGNETVAYFVWRGKFDTPFPVTNSTSNLGTAPWSFCKTC